MARPDASDAPPGSIVLIGGGLAAASTAQGLRDRGFDGSVVIIGDEPNPPYERPPLSKTYLSEHAAADELTLLDADRAAELELTIRTGERADALDRGAGEVVLESGHRIAADAVLLATGGTARTLPRLSGEHVHTLRTRADAERLRATLGSAERLLLVGFGFVGAEVAATARAFGVEVTAVEVDGHPFARVLGGEVAEALLSRHREAGVDLRTRTTVEACDPTREGVLAELSDGSRVEATAVLVGVGMAPSTGLAADAGLDVDDGVVCDASGRSSLPGVWAAGDVARWEHPLHGAVRVEHYDTALRHGEVVAASILGGSETYEEPHWFWTDQHEQRLQVAGVTADADDVVVHGPDHEGRLLAFYRSGEVVCAVAGIDRTRDVRGGRRLVTARATPSRSELADPDVDLRALARAHR
ncbi:NAD(P)/FAD-dependent oxidoreductase [Egibacter rhizosphaerae]|uniref:NAD(P)/FAD-dependent oxidoreductase n=1 Tax=Egibacter rhizosphaerae TaxID=1670831 RepID=UPI0013F16E9C|nr:FAD-dependent oxidoreductase [Egibacter rhizosphaerae]